MEVQEPAHVAQQQAAAAVQVAALQERLVRIDELAHLTGLSRSSLYALQAKDEFPRSVLIGGNRVAWKLSSVMAWISQRPCNNKVKP